MLGWEGVREDMGSFFMGLLDRQIEEMLNDSIIWRKLRSEWTERCNRSSKLQYWV